MVKILNQTVKWLAAAEFWLGGTLLVLMICINFAEIVSRKLFNYSLFWVQDATLLFACWVVFLGAAYLFHHKEMIQIDYAVNKLPKAAKTMVAYVADILVVFFLIYVIRYGIKLQALQSMSKSYALHVPTNWFSLPFLICAAAIIVSIARDIAVRLSGGDEERAA